MGFAALYPSYEFKLRWSEGVMTMRQTVGVISQMEADAIIGRYAIGGAVAWSCRV
jgi:hypothetical protein